MEEVDLSPQQQRGGWCKAAKASTVVRQETEDEGYDQEYEQVLQCFVEMMDVLRSQPGVTGMVVSGKLAIWRNERGMGKKLSLRESYDGTSGNRRKYLSVTFEYQDRYVCLVEIAQERLSSRYGTFIIITSRALDGTKVHNLTKLFVENTSVKKRSDYSRSLASSLRRRSIRSTRLRK